MHQQSNEKEVCIRFKKKDPLVVGNEVFKSAYDWELTNKDMEKAHRELGENEEKKKECLQKLKEKMLEDGNVTFRQDDFYLVRYLRVRKYDILKTYNTIKLLYKLRKKNSDFITLPPELESVQKLNLVTCLPYTDEEGRMIILLNFDRWNPYEKSFEEMIQTAANVADIISMNPKCQINGLVAIYDLNGITFKHCSELLWKNRIWAYLSFVLNAYPWRLKKILVLNTNKTVRFLFSIVKPLVPAKIVERVYFLGSDMDELHQHVNPALLPKRLKGTLEEEECDMSQLVLDNLSYIRYERSFGS